MKNIIVIFLMGMSYCSFSQSIERDILSAGGKTASASNLQLCYTVGELAVETVSAPGIMLCQGFQQGTSSNVDIKQNGTNTFIVNVFPNPTRDITNFNFSSGQTGTFQYSVLSLTGQLIMRKTNIEFQSEMLQSIDISHLSAGIYLFDIQIETDSKKQSYQTKIQVIK